MIYPKKLGNIALTTALLVSTVLFADAQESINYLLFDVNKMERYDYTATENFPRVPHWDYHLRMGNNKKLIFRVEKQKIYQDTVSEIDKKELTASQTDFFTDTYIDAVNSGSKFIYILEQKAPNLIVKRQVNRIIRYAETADMVSYRDRQHDFEYTYNRIYEESDKNLSFRKDKGAKVLHQSREKKECTNMRTFRTFSGHAEDPFEDVKFIEGIGLYSIVSAGAELKLKNINDAPIDPYLKAYCAEIAKAENKALQNAEKATPQNTVVDNPTKNPYDNSSITNNPYANSSTTVADTGRKTSPYGGTHDPYSGLGGTGGTTPNTKIEPKEFVPAGDPCAGVSPLDVNNPCNQRIVVSRPITAAEPPPVGGYYVAQTGDNLYKIANKFGLTTKTLMCLNNKKDYSVGILEKFLVVDGDGRCTQSVNPITRVDQATGTTKRIHVVEQGESLGKIAAKYNVTLERLCQLNGFDDTTMGKIQIDQEIVISVDAL